MKLDYLIVGQRIRAIRKRKKMSQALLSEKADLDPTYICYIENGTRCMSLESLIAIANALDVTADVLLCDSLENQLAAPIAELENILRDCTNHERRIILDTIRGLKQSLRDNYYLKK